MSIGNSVTSIGESAFSYCDGLTSITIPNSVTRIDSSAFEYCSGLASITIPNSVTSIGRAAFLYCSGLTSVTIPNSVTNIGISAFSGCKGLTSITILNSVTSIGEDAFRGCGSINSLYFNSNVLVDLGIFTYVKELYYEDDLSIVYPILSTSELTKVVLGKNVEYIRQNAFYGAPLKEFYITGEKDIYLDQDVFKNVNLSYAKLYIPMSRAAYYRTTAPWKDFGKIVYLETTSINNNGIDDVKVWTNDYYLYIENAPLNSTVYIYSTSGEMLENCRVHGKKVTIQLPRKDVYIIKVGEKMMKVKI